MKKKTYAFDFTLADIKEHQVLPHNFEIERQVLGYFVKHQSEFEQYYKYLKPKGMFYSEVNDKTWQVLLEKQSNKVHYRPDDLKAHFMAKNDKDTAFHCVTLAAYSCLPSEIINLCLKLNEYWIQRTFYRMGHYVIKNSIDDQSDKLDLLGNISDSTSKIFLHIAGMKERSLSDAASELQKELADIQIAPNGMLGIPSSLYGINNAIKGYRKSNLIVIAASTGEGKTTLALQDAHHSLKQNIPIGYVSLEMSTQELMMMMACAELGIDTQDILQGGCDMQKVIDVSNYVSKIEKMPLKITDRAGMTIGEIKAIAKGWKDKFGIKQLFIDHIHLANGDVEYSNSEQKFTDIANKLKELAKELEIPVIALAQLARKELSDKRMHQVTDIKYAGGIEQAADVILMPFRAEHHGIETDGSGDSTKGKAVIIIGKLRLLPKQNIKCNFTGMKFTHQDTFVPPQTFEIDNPRAGFIPMPSRPPQEFWND
jgi:replicative DNA helicase